VLWNGLFINSLSAHVPPRVSISDIDSSMDLSDALAGFVTVAKSDQQEHRMAGLAAREAVDHSDHAGERLAAIVYVNTSYAVDHMAAVCHLQRILRQPETLAFELNAASNGGMAGMEVLARLMSTDPTLSAGLLTAVARIPDGVDRWMGGTLNGDGAVAAVLSKTAGFARVVATQRMSNPELEVTSRNRATKLGDWDTKATKEGIAPYVETITQDVSSVIAAILAEADITMQHISHVILPSFPLTSLQQIYLDRNAIPIAKTCWEDSRRNGHIGPCDQLLGLKYLMDTHRLERGQLVLMIGSGLGFQYTCALLEIVDCAAQPDPAESR